MENQNKKTNTTKKTKKNNPMKKIGKTIKNTFIEMSSSLAGWIDDTGTQFSGKKKNNANKVNNSSATKTTVQSKTSSAPTNNK